MNKKKQIILAIILALLVLAAIFFGLLLAKWKWDGLINGVNNTNKSAVNDTSPRGAYCIQDVKECPDGSFVGRDSTRDCEFRPCP